MQIVIVKNEKLYKYPFPSIDIESYDLKDLDENYNERTLASIGHTSNNWILKGTDGCHIFDAGNEVKEVTLNLNKFYYLQIKETHNVIGALLYITEENDKDFQAYKVNDGTILQIGSNPGNDICLSNSLVSPMHALLSFNNGKFKIENKDTKYGVYVNDNKISSRELINGDSIFILGFVIIVVNNILIINNFNNGRNISSNNLSIYEFPKYKSELLETVNDDNAVLYSENDYYSRSPRFVTSVTEETISIDNPPGKVEEDKTPLILTVGPMITMAMSSMVSVTSTISSLISGGGTLKTTWPTILVAIAMLVSTLLWPSLMKSYNKEKVKKQEEERQKKYIDYLAEKRKKIETLRVNQHQILLENYPEVKDLASVIINKKRTLWQRTVESEDFLNVRVGLGSVPLKVNVNYSIEGFTMSPDNLKFELNKVAKSAEDINNAPVTVDLINRNKLVLIGETSYRESMLKNIILQLATYHSYYDLKLVFMLSDTNNEMWNSFKTLPHVWSNSRDVRFFGTNYDDISKISFYLEQAYMARKYSDDNGQTVENDIDYRNVRPYYLIIVDNIKKNKNVEIINKILKEKRNLGFGLIVLNDDISNLPNECNDFLMASGEKSAVISNDLNKNNQTAFVMDKTDDIDIPLLCEKLSNIPIKMPLLLDEMKDAVGFLEMYKVGKIESLNILNRWKTNNPVNSLSVPIGIHTDGEIFNLDLHEKFHGPHGLIAGMTGSGKSEFIITYILSMCLNFNPEEVSFVLIDYKGGGLTGAFENELTGVVLPHLAGTITNLDTSEIKRSLASIHSELKRRQELFNKAKLKLNESTIDIYKYQKLTRDGKISEPISHLFIISDEFAELKNEQKDFMDELISTARIGRSLGVHLILATQKPSGIVDDQIWSNSKFKVCLKVQEKADSMDVIKCADAATLKKAGRFYLQVGYNDYFAMGQSAYAGVKYLPKDEVSKTVDRNLSFINDIGDVVASIETSKKEEITTTVSLGEELPNILKYICDNANNKNMKAKQLWLPKIPKEIFVNDLMKKYNYVTKKWDIRPIIGEYDDPNNQRQDLLTLNFNENGNTIIYGVSGSGKEVMLTTILYSLIINHSSDELNIYVIDFGSEMFSIFKNAPQVGDIVFINEQEKLVNLLNAANKELDLRKKLFVEYNGDYNLYIKNSGKTLPRIIIVINNYESFTESYEDYVDNISSLSREGEKYGISFIITASGVNAVRGKTSQNFSNLICLQFNDPSDYSSIIGSTHGMVPTSCIGRGLIKIDTEIYEYQTAFPYKWEEITSFIKDICDKLSNNISVKADKIAILPNHVRLSNIRNKITNISSVPIGIEKDTLVVSTFDFTKNPISIITTQDSMYLDKFIPSLIQVLNNVSNVKTYIIDANSVIKEAFENYYSNNYEEALTNMENVINTKTDYTNIFIIFGIDAFKSGLAANSQTKFKNLLIDLKKNQHVKVIIADDVSKIKSIEYEEFYKSNVQPSFAIWIGSGLSDQFTVKTSTYNKSTRGQLESGFGFNVNRGNARLVKFIDFYSKD